MTEAVILCVLTAAFLLGRRVMRRRNERDPLLRETEEWRDGQ